MDPNILLARLLAWAKQDDPTRQCNEAVHAARDLLDLHEWLSRSGSLPTPWRKSTVKQPYRNTSPFPPVREGIWDD